MKLKIVILSLICCCLLSCKKEVAKPALIPYPNELILTNGSFDMNRLESIVVTDKNKFGSEAVYLQSLLEDFIGKNLPISESGNKSIVLTFSPDFEKEEAYSLTISSDKIVLSAKDGHGIFNGIQTLRQMLCLYTENGKFILPGIQISDSPAFDYRGMHMDVSRHFFNLDYVKKHLDNMAFYKFNKFHWHLTDDQGWRIEIKQYPKLTSEGAYRTFNNHDRECIRRSSENPNYAIDPRYIEVQNGDTIYGGFYTQEEIKEIIQYAADRHIEIIPEIDMPGHMMAAIKAYPYLIEGEFSWGEVFSKPLCPCKDEVYTFTKNVLSEIAELFPSKYIHIGADEVDKTSWGKSKLCQTFMKNRGIETLNELQSYFVHEMQDFLAEKGKTIIAWDEILDGGTNPDVVVMYWRGWVKNSPLKAVENGNKLIMTPTNPLYFDYKNNNTSVDNVYHMDVVYKEIPEDKRHLIWGAQANSWAEYIPTEAQREFQIYPRMLALSERVWTDNTTRFDDFSQRLLKHYPILDEMGVNYRLPDIEGFAQENVYVDKIDFLPKSPLTTMKIRYTLDESIPNLTSPELNTPLTISEPTLLKMALFSPGGVRGEIYSLNFHPTEWKVPTTPGSIAPGLSCDFFQKYYRNTKGMEGEPTESFVVNNIQAPKEAPSFGLKFNGFLDIPETGIYSFFFTCDDGGVLYIGEETIINNDGQHSPVQKSGQAALEKGMHPFRLDFIEAGGGYTLKLQYSFNGSDPKDIPDNWFKH